MTIIILIPIVLFYISLFIVMFSLIITTIFCHRENAKIHSKVTEKSSDHIAVNSFQKRGIKAIYKKLYGYLYGLSRYMSVCVGRIPSHRIRKMMLKKVFCMKLANRAVIYGGFELRSPWRISIGNSVIGVGALLDGRNGITIEDNVCLAQSVSIYTEQHDVNDRDFKCNDKGGPVIIKRNSWISSKTTILPKCVIAEGCVLASGGVLTKSTIEYGIYGGIPAKKIAERVSPMEYELSGEYWHFY